MPLLIRWLHVSSVAFILGGALLIFILLHVTHRNQDASSRRVLQDLMRIFEWGSWASIGLVIATGIGNLGHFGASLPDARSDWGKELTLKLGLVVVFLLFSGIRSLAVAVASTQSEDQPMTPRARRSLAGLYGATAVLVTSIMGVAVALAHF